MKLTLPRRWVRRPPVPAYHIRVLGAEQSEDGPERWAVTFEELPGCLAQGASLTEAEAVLWRIAPAYISQLTARGQSVPTPHRPGAVTFLSVSIAVLPIATGSGPSDAGITAPLVSKLADLRTVSQRLDATLRGS